MGGSLRSLHYVALAPLGLRPSRGPTGRCELMPVDALPMWGRASTSFNARFFSLSSARRSPWVPLRESTGRGRAVWGHGDLTHQMDVGPTEGWPRVRWRHGSHGGMTSGGNTPVFFTFFSGRST